MEITAVRFLSPEQKQQIHSLEMACRKENGSFLSFPSEDGNFFFLALKNSQLLGAFSLFCLESGLYECMAAVFPEQRNKGIFSSLLQKAEDCFPDDDFCFVTDGTCPAVFSVLEKLQAEFWYSEHMMRLSFSSFPSVHSAESPSKQLSISNPENGIFHGYLGKQQIGTCCIMEQKYGAYLYSLEILPSFRNQGYGKAFLSQVLAILSARFPFVTLQVSGDNEAALHLYQKAGFSITETLSYYLY